jgi:hypothetical protein
MAAERPLRAETFTHVEENAPLSRIALSLTALALAAVITAGAGTAQTSGTKPAAKPAPATSTQDASKPSTLTQVENWTAKQWEAAKKEWTKDTKKWADCRKRSNKQKLEGRKSWSFLYKCMTG